MAPHLCRHATLRVSAYQCPIITKDGLSQNLFPSCSSSRFISSGYCAPMCVLPRQAPEHTHLLPFFGASVIHSHPFWVELVFVCEAPFSRSACVKLWQQKSPPMPNRPLPPVPQWTRHVRISHSFLPPLAAPCTPLIPEATLAAHPCADSVTGRMPPSLGQGNR